MLQGMNITVAVYSLQINCSKCQGGKTCRLSLCSNEKGKLEVQIKKSIFSDKGKKMNLQRRERELAPSLLIYVLHI